MERQLQLDSVPVGGLFQCHYSQRCSNLLISVSVYEISCFVLGINIVKLIFASRNITIELPHLISSVLCLLSLCLSRSLPLYLCNSPGPTMLVTSQTRLLQHGGSLVTKAAGKMKESFF